ncbi:MAG: NitT/TauT family transport system substrate-binding protein [Phormidesmis priestleyi Ana]|uniref:NitT/TauT family transport system substrate-binding protein n=1 Tax=Phormidesmis priestleyi Ana TaxID=1666911 RepID=A0A0N8KLW0_9CYAN|nr:MAG: NitT/TauT family transport system substrate-binding protein [Phormidesmis priestleyi Ana]
MEIYQLKVFLEVARHLSFTEAADALNLTQPAVSAKIKSLEQSLGTELFNRLGRKIKLTAVGDYLLETGPGLLEMEGRLIQEIEEIKQGKFSHLKIGCTVNVANGWLPKILFEYRQKHPEIDLQCQPFESVHQLHQAITLGEVDVGFSETNLNGFDEIDSVAVDSFQYCLMVAADHRLAKADWLSLKNLTAEPWAFPAAATPERLALESRINELGMQLSDFSHYEIVESSSLMSMFLSQGHYLGFASSLQFQTERKAQMLKAVSLQEFSLNMKLFMLQLKRTLKSNSPQKTLSKGPLQQLIQLITQRTGQGLNRASPPHSPNLSIPVYLKAPGLSIRRPSLPKKITISIGTQNKTIQTVTAGVIIQRLGLLEHFLPHDGQYHNAEYSIHWHDFTSGAPIVSGLQSDHLDIGILGDYPLLLSGVCAADATGTGDRPAAKTRLVSFVASNPDGAGNTIIVPNRSPLTSLDDLRRRVIAVPFASAAHGMIMRSLSRANLLPEVTLTSIDNLNLHQLTPRDNQADGYAYFAPLHDIANHKGQFRRLLEADLDKLPTFHGVVVREAFAEAHPDIVIAYLKALIAAQYWYETTPSALSLVSSWVRLNPEIVAKTLDYQRSGATGLFFPETQIRTDWIVDHIAQLSTISGNEALSELNLDTWIQPELLETALSSL